MLTRGLASDTYLGGPAVKSNRGSCFSSFSHYAGKRREAFRDAQAYGAKL